MELHIKTNKCNQVSSSPPKEELPCIPILLSILMGEYEQERARSERIDNKAIGHNNYCSNYCLCSDFPI